MKIRIFFTKGDIYIEAKFLGFYGEMFHVLIDGYEASDHFPLDKIYKIEVLEGQ